MVQQPTPRPRRASQALKHAAINADRKLVVEWIEAADLELGKEKTAPEEHADAWKRLRAAHGECEGDGGDCAPPSLPHWRVAGVLVPGGFGDRGVEGKILAIQHAREKGTPFLGICLGMQCAVIEFARSAQSRR